MPYLGPDVVDLIFRDDAPGLDDDGHPNTVDRIIVGKRNSSVTVSTATEAKGVAANRDNGMVIRYTAKAMLPFDDDCLALTATCAIRHDGRVYELTADGIPKRTLRGAPDHVRVYAVAEVTTLERGEQIIITPTFGRDTTGQPRPYGPPLAVIARSVTPGNTTQTIGDDGAVDAADFTIALDIDVPIKDDDRVTVRGRTGWARVAVNLEEWEGRSTKVVLVRSRRGGRR